MAYIGIVLSAYGFAVIILSVIFLICMSVLWSYKKRDRLTSLMEKMPGQMKFPVIGTSYMILFVFEEGLYHFMKNRFPLYYGMFRNWIGSVPNVNLSKPEHAELILNNSVQLTKSSAYNYIKPWLGEGLLISSGKKWHNHRKMLTPAFHFKILDGALGTFDSKAQLLVKQFTNMPIGEIFDTYPYITNCALDIICETAMGVELNSMFEENTKYVNAIYTVTSISLRRIVSPWLQPDFIFKRTKTGKLFEESVNILHDFTSKMINDRKLILSKSNRSTDQDSENCKLIIDDLRISKPRTFLDILLLQQQCKNPEFELTDEDIRQEVDTFLFEGHDTTTAAIGWCVFLLGNHLDIQEKVYEEICNAFENHKGPVTMELLGELKLLERCIKEALRLYPSVPVVARLLQKDVDIDGYTVPAGCTANLYIYMIHRDARYFDKPEEFNPDRFLTENIKKKHAYSYIPFSAGPRNCIGQKYAMLEEKTILAYIFKNFKVKSVETEEMVEPVIELILRPLNGVRVILRPRE